MKQFIGILKNIGYIVGFAAVVVGAYKMYDNIVDNQSEIKEDVEYINVEQSMMAADIMDIKDTVVRVEGKIDKMRDKIESQDEVLDDFGYVLRKRHDFSEEQVEELISRALKKNEPIVYIAPEEPE